MTYIDKTARHEPWIRLVGMGAAGLVALLAWAGCERQPRRASAQPPGGQAQDQQGEDVCQNASEANSSRFSAHADPKAVTAGQETTVAFRVRAASGLKPNEEYPTWRFELCPPSGVQMAATEFSREDVELNDGEAVFRTKVTAERPGTTTIDAVGNFSMCNDSNCYLMRDEALSFSVEAESAGSSGRPE